MSRGLEQDPSRAKAGEQQGRPRAVKGNQTRAEGTERRLGGDRNQAGGRRTGVGAITQGYWRDRGQRDKSKTW